MADRWWRAYDSSIDHPKLLKLSDAMHRAWYTLQCVASANGGVLPPTDDIAARLRMKPAKVAEWITSLVKAGLIDNNDGVFRPHNWDTRQYLSDSSKERVKRHREKRSALGLVPQWSAPAALRKAVYNADNFECVYCGSDKFLSIDHKTSELSGGTHDFENLVTACRSCNGAKRDLSFDEYVTKANLVTLHGRYSNSPRVQTTEQNTEFDVAEEDARVARNPAFDLAEKLLVIAGHDPAFWPPGWVTAHMRVETWLSQGWSPEIIIAATTAAAARKHGPPANSVQFFEKAIAEEVARQAAPLPTVKVRQPENLTVTSKQHGNPNGSRSVHDAARDLSDKLLRELDEPAPRLREPAGGGVVRLLPSR